MIYPRTGAGEDGGGVVFSRTAGDEGGGGGCAEVSERPPPRCPVDRLRQVDYGTPGLAWKLSIVKTCPLTLWMFFVRGGRQPVAWCMGPNTTRPHIKGIIAPVDTARIQMSVTRRGADMPAGTVALFWASMDNGVTHGAGPATCDLPWAFFVLPSRWGGGSGVLIAADCGVCVAFGSGWSAAKAGGFWRGQPPATALKARKDPAQGWQP